MSKEAHLKTVSDAADRIQADFANVSAENQKLLVETMALLVGLVRALAVTSSSMNEVMAENVAAVSSRAIAYISSIRGGGPEALEAANNPVEYLWNICESLLGGGVPAASGLDRTKN